MSGCGSEAGRLFQILGTATETLLSASRVFALRTVRTLAWVKRSWGRPESAISWQCMLNHCLEWDKWVLTNFDHDRQWFNTLIPLSHESASVTVDCISRLSGPVRLALRYTTVDIHCKDRRYEWDGGINDITFETTNKKYRKTTTADSHHKHPLAYCIG